MKPAPAAAKPRPPRKLPAWLARAQRLFLQPTQEWSTIAPEFTTAGAIYGRFLVPMAAIGPIAATLGGVVFGERGSLLTFGVVPVSLSAAVQTGVLEYVLNLVGVYVLAIAIDTIGGSLGGSRNRVQALKVAAYGSTPYWLAGVFALFPRIEPLAMLVGLWSFRLFAAGLGPVMKAPRDKSAAYILLTCIAATLLVLVITAVITRLVVA
ncbi:MAG TPA: Yip1 family protein [Gemmatimonadales bacterium]|nr:Yip1 family protein [Gemmatimonadales bacterium]